MNYIDIILATILLYAAYRGFSKGFVIQIATLIALLLGIIGAIRFSHFVASVLIEKLELTGKYLPVVSFALTFIGIVILVHLIARLTDTLIKAIALGFINRLAGAVFSIAKFGLIMSVFINILNGIDNKKSFLPQEEINQSILYRPIMKFAPSIFPYLKNQFENFNTDYFEKEKAVISL
ncbi:MAG: CvpA family protein [Bacteroidota bacterium]